MVCSSALFLSAVSLAGVFFSLYLALAIAGLPVVAAWSGIWDIEMAEPALFAPGVVIAILGCLGLVMMVAMQPSTFPVVALALTAFFAWDSLRLFGADVPGIESYNSASAWIDSTGLFPTTKPIQPRRS